MNTYGNIVVTGTTGSGKTTLASAVAQRTGRRLIDLDDLYWLPQWQPRQPEDFRARVAMALSQGDGATPWVVAGNYSTVQDIVWGQAQTLVALDYAAPVIFWRLWRRTLARVTDKQPVCNGNTESIRRAFFNRDSIFVWFFKTYAPRRKKLAALIENPGDYAHMRILHFTTPQKARQWLDTLT